LAVNPAGVVTGVGRNFPGVKPGLPIAIGMEADTPGVRKGVKTWLPIAIGMEADTPGVRKEISPALYGIKWQIWINN
jgi:hypothetical protein